MRGVRNIERVRDTRYVECVCCAYVVVMVGCEEDLERVCELDGVVVEWMLHRKRARLSFSCLRLKRAK